MFSVAVLFLAHLSNEHIVHHGAKAPPINHLSIELAGEGLWGHELHSATKGAGLTLVLICGHLAEAKIREEDMASLVKENVLRLQVPVDDAKVVQVLQGEDDLGEVELAHVLHHEALLLEAGEQLPSTRILKNQVQLPFCLEGVLQVHNERVGDHAKDITLGLGVLSVLGVHDDGGLLQNFHRKV